MARSSRPQVVVITGASAGVGRACVRRFAREGASIALVARGEDGLEGARRDVEEEGGRALVIPCDVADAAAVEDAAARTERELGPIDVWINNAMVTVFGPFTEVTPEEFERVTQVTYLGQVYGCMAALRRMLPRDHGTIVCVGSALAYRGIPLQSAYCGAKHAIQGFTESLRSELLHDGSNVKISMVQLPALNTPQFSWGRNKIGKVPQPVPPIYQPEVAAEAIHHAARHAPRELNATFNTSVVIQGNKLLAGVGDHYLAHKGYSGQITARPVPAGQPDNLFSPVRGDHGAHGMYGARAKDRSLQLWARTHKAWLAAAAALFGFSTVGAAAMLAPARNRRWWEWD